MWKLQLSFELQQWASVYLLLISFQEMSLKNLLKDCRLLLIKWVFSRYPTGPKSHNGDLVGFYIPNALEGTVRTRKEKFVTEIKKTFLASTYNKLKKKKKSLWSFCLLGDLEFSQSVASSSEDQFPSGSFGFVRGWTDPMWSLWLRACNWQIWRQQIMLPQREQPTRMWSYPFNFDGSLSHAAQLSQQSSVNFSSQLSGLDWAERRGWAYYHLQYWEFSEIFFNVHTAP